MDNMDMEDEVVKTKPERKVEEKKNVQLTVPVNFLHIAFSLLALVIWMIVAIVRNFGVVNGTLHGIVSMVVYALPLIGAVFVYLKEQKLTPEWWFNIATLFLVLSVLGF